VPCSINNWQVAGTSFLRLLLPATIDDVFSLVRSVLQSYAVQCFFSEGEWFFAETFLRKFLRCRITPFLVQLRRCHCPSVPRKLSLSGYTGSGSQHFDLSIL
jgi:hypothetical protein